ncbi:MAG: hypothetical protein ACLTXL_05315 [Clostridia bacterium]
MGIHVDESVVSVGGFQDGIALAIVEGMVRSEARRSSVVQRTGLIDLDTASTLEENKLIRIWNRMPGKIHGSHTGDYGILPSIDKVCFG